MEKRTKEGESPVTEMARTPMRKYGEARGTLSEDGRTISQG